MQRSERLTFQELKWRLGLTIRLMRGSAHFGVTRQPMTQQQLAERAGISQEALCRIENGERANLGTIYRIAVELGVDLSDLFKQTEVVVVPEQVLEQAERVLVRCGRLSKSSNHNGSTGIRRKRRTR